MTTPPPPVGPYEAWVYGPGRDGDLPALLLHEAGVLGAVAELDGGVAAAGLPPGWLPAQPGQPDFLLPALWQGGQDISFLPFLMQPGGAPLPDLGPEALAEQAGRLRDRLPLPAAAWADRLNYPLRDGTLDSAFPGTEPAPAAAGPAPRVVVALIDEGIALCHRNLRCLAGTTRIDRLWAQGAAPAGDGRVPFGRALTGPEIDALLATHAGDERAVYAALGLSAGAGPLPMPLDRASCHGAHVADSLAGCWPAQSEDEVRVVAVDLPPAVSWDTSGFGKDMLVLSALHWIFRQADSIAAVHGTGPLPLVINLSYGHSGGPHDATGFLPAAFDELVGARRQQAPTALVLPAGNSFQQPLHAVLEPGHFTAATAGQSAELRWMLPPADRTSTYLEVWFPHGTPIGEIRLALIAPDGQIAAELAGGPDAAVAVDAGTGPCGRLAFEHFRGRRWRALAAMAATEPRHPGLPAAPAGEWRVRVTLAGTATLPTASAIRFWIQRDDSPGQGNTGARQSWFVDPLAPDYGPDGAPVQADPEAEGAVLRRFGSLNGMATGACTLVVAGWRQGGAAIAAPYSSAGGAPDGAAPGTPVIAAEAVDVSAPSERGRWTPGIRAAGTLSGSALALSGTSSAAPQVARHLAEIFRRDGAGLGPGDATHNYADLLAPLSIPPPPPDGTAPGGRRRLGAWVLPSPPRRAPGPASGV